MKIVKTYSDQKRLVLVDAEEWAALSAAVVIAYDTLPPGIQPEMAEAAGRLWAGTQGPELKHDWTGPRDVRGFRTCWRCDASDANPENHGAACPGWTGDRWNATPSAEPWMTYLDEARSLLAALTDQAYTTAGDLRKLAPDLCEESYNVAGAVHRAARLIDTAVEKYGER